MPIKSACGKTSANKLRTTNYKMTITSVKMNIIYDEFAKLIAFIPEEKTFIFLIYCTIFNKLPTE